MSPNPKASPADVAWLEYLRAHDFPIEEYRAGKPSRERWEQLARRHEELRREFYGVGKRSR